MSTYNTSEFRKGLKVQIDGNPFIMVECQFVKPGKGQALYKCKLRDLNRGTILERTYKNGDELEAADIHETDNHRADQHRPMQALRVLIADATHHRLRQGNRTDTDKDPLRKIQAHRHMPR